MLCLSLSMSFRLSFLLQNVAALVMTIFSALAAAILLGFEIAGAVYAASNGYEYGYKNKWVKYLIFVYLF